nr:GHKL domain-containing protein [Clostridium saccharobutylicum]
MEVKNNFEYEPVLVKNGFIISKRCKENHGTSIHIVEKVVQKFSGKLKIDIDSNEFVASIIFQVLRNAKTYGNRFEVW